MTLKCTPILCLLLTAILSTTNFTASAMSFPDAEHMKRLSTLEAEKPFEMRSLDLFRSPIQPGGSWGVTLAPQNILLQLKKLNSRLKMLNLYVATLVDSDDAVIALRNDPAPDANWKAKLRALEAETFERLKLEVIQEYALKSE